MKKPFRIALYVAGGVLTLYSALVVYTIRTAGSDEGRFVAPKGDLPGYVAGRWDWKGRPRPCTDSAVAFARREHLSGAARVLSTRYGTSPSVDPKPHDT